MLLIKKSLVLISSKNFTSWVNFYENKLIYFEARHLNIDDWEWEVPSKLEWSEQWKLTREEFESLHGWKNDIIESSESLWKHINKYKEKIWLEEAAIKADIKILPPSIKTQLSDLNTHLGEFETDVKDNCLEIGYLIDNLINQINVRINKIETSVEQEVAKNIPLTQDLIWNILKNNQWQFEIYKGSLFNNEQCAQGMKIGPLQFPSRADELSIGMSVLLPPQVRKVWIKKANWQKITAVRSWYAGNFYTPSGQYAEILNNYNITILENDNSVAQKAKQNFESSHGEMDTFAPDEKQTTQIDNQEITERELIYQMALRQNVDPVLLLALRKTEDGKEGREFWIDYIDTKNYIAQLNIAARSISDGMADFKNTFPEDQLYHKSWNPTLSLKFITFYSLRYFTLDNWETRKDHIQKLSDQYWKYKKIKFDSSKIEGLIWEMKDKIWIYENPGDFSKFRPFKTSDHRHKPLTHEPLAKETQTQSEAPQPTQKEWQSFEKFSYWTEIVLESGERVNLQNFLNKYISKQYANRGSNKIKLSEWLGKTIESPRLYGIQYSITQIWEDWKANTLEENNETEPNYMASSAKIFAVLTYLEMQNWKINKEELKMIAEVFVNSNNDNWRRLWYAIAHKKRLKDILNVPISICRSSNTKRAANEKIRDTFIEMYGKNGNWLSKRPHPSNSLLLKANFWSQVLADMNNWKFAWWNIALQLMQYVATWWSKSAKYLPKDAQVITKTWTWNHYTKGDKSKWIPPRLIKSYSAEMGIIIYKGKRFAFTIQSESKKKVWNERIAQTIKYLFDKYIKNAV